MLFPGHAKSLNLQSPSADLDHGVQSQPAMSAVDHRRISSRFDKVYKETKPSVAHALVTVIEDGGTWGTRALLIDNMPMATTGLALQSVFEQYGVVESTEPGPTDFCRQGCGCVTFESVDDAIRARRDLDGKKIFGDVGVPVKIRFDDTQIRDVTCKASRDEAKVASPTIPKDRNNEWFTPRPKNQSKQGVEAKRLEEATNGMEHQIAANRKHDRWPNGPPPTGPKACSIDISPPPLRRGDTYRPENEKPRVDSYRPGIEQVSAQWRSSDHRRASNGDELGHKVKSDYANRRDSRPEHFDIELDGTMDQQEGRADSHLARPVFAGSLQWKKTTDDIPDQSAKGGSCLRERPAGASTFSIPLDRDWPLSLPDLEIHEPVVVPQIPVSTTTESCGLQPNPVSPAHSLSKDEESDGGSYSPQYTLAPTQGLCNPVQAAPIHHSVQPSPLSAAQKMAELKGASSPLHDLFENVGAPMMKTISPFFRQCVLNDETASLTTERSISTTSSRRKKKCFGCGGVYMEVSPLHKCATCSRRFHACCGTPMPASFNNKADFICGLCTKAEKLEDATTVTYLPQRPPSPHVKPHVPIVSDTFQTDVAATTSSPIAAVQLPIEDPVMIAIDHRTRGVVMERNGWEAEREPRPNLREVKRVITTAQTTAQKPAKNESDPSTFHNEENNSMWLQGNLPPSKSYTCTFWKKKGWCRFADEDCHYSHHDTGTLADLKAYKLVTCHFWMKGHCRHEEDACLYAHYNTGSYAADPGQWSKSEPANHRSLSEHLTRKSTSNFDAPVSPGLSQNATDGGQRTQFCFPNLASPFSFGSSRPKDGAHGPSSYSASNGSASDSRAGNWPRPELSSIRTETIKSGSVLLNRESRNSETDDPRIPKVPDYEQSLLLGHEARKLPLLGERNEHQASLVRSCIGTETYSLSHTNAESAVRDNSPSGSIGRPKQYAKKTGRLLDPRRRHNSNASTGITEKQGDAAREDGIIPEASITMSPIDGDDPTTSGSINSVIAHVHRQCRFCQKRLFGNSDVCRGCESRQDDQVHKLKPSSPVVAESPDHLIEQDFAQALDTSNIALQLESSANAAKLPRDQMGPKKSSELARSLKRSGTDDLMFIANKKQKTVRSVFTVGRDLLNNALPAALTKSDGPALDVDSPDKVTAARLAVVPTLDEMRENVQSRKEAREPGAIHVRQSDLSNEPRLQTEDFEQPGDELEIQSQRKCLASVQHPTGTHAWEGPPSAKQRAHAAHSVSASPRHMPRYAFVDLPSPRPTEPFCSSLWENTATEEDEAVDGKEAVSFPTIPGIACKTCRGRRARCLHDDDGELDQWKCRKWLKDFKGRTDGKRSRAEIAEIEAAAAGKKKLLILEEEVDETFEAGDEDSSTDELMNDQPSMVKISVNSNTKSPAKHEPSLTKVSPLEREKKPKVSIRFTMVSRTPKTISFTKKDERKAIAHLAARGVVFETESDSDSGKDEASSEPDTVVTYTRPRDPLWQRPRKSRNLLDIAPEYRQQDEDSAFEAVTIARLGPKRGVPRKELWHIRRFEVKSKSDEARLDNQKAKVMTLRGRQCAERRLRFGNAHWEVERSAFLNTTSTTRMVRTLEESRILPFSGKGDVRVNGVSRSIFDVSVSESRNVEMAFEKFMGMPETAVPCLIGSGNVVEGRTTLGFREAKKDKERARDWGRQKRIRVPDEEKWPVGDKG